MCPSDAAHSFSLFSLLTVSAVIAEIFLWCAVKGGSAITFATIDIANPANTIINTKAFSPPLVFLMPNIKSEIKRIPKKPIAMPATFTFDMLTSPPANRLVSFCFGGRHNPIPTPCRGITPRQRITQQVYIALRPFPFRTPRGKSSPRCRDASSLANDGTTVYLSL